MPGQMSPDRRQHTSPGRLIGVATKGSPFGANIVARGLLVGTPGTANLIDDQNVTYSNVPLQLGYNPIDGIVQVAAGGTADNIWPLI
jgi:hypothetical protein